MPEYLQARKKGASRGVNEHIQPVFEPRGVDGEHRLTSCRHLCATSVPSLRSKLLLAALEGWETLVLAGYPSCFQ